MTGYNDLKTSGAPIKAWTKGVELEEAAERQLRNVAALPFIHRHLAAMPDVHWGMGATVGSVIATKGAIIPAVTRSRSPPGAIGPPPACARPTTRPAH